MIRPVEGDVELVHELVQPLVHEADLDLAVAHLLEDRRAPGAGTREDDRELERLAARRASHALRRVAAQQEAPAYGFATSKTLKSG